MKNDNKQISKIQVEFDEKILSDKSVTGKERPWKKHKGQSLAVSEIFKMIDDVGTLPYRIKDCGSFLKFGSCPEGHEKRLLSANFCKCRMCPMCQWRRSLVIFYQVLAVSHKHKEEFTSDIPLFLTLTVPSVTGESLTSRIALMQKAWHLFIKRKIVKRVCRSWFRSLEVTYNAARDDYHPHYHVLIFVPRSYFDKSRCLYISRDKWLSIWQEVTKLREITQVDIRRVRKSRKSSVLEAVSAEIAKYSVKPSDYLKKLSEGVYEANKVVLEVLHFALRRKRLVAFGGKFKEYKKAMKMEDAENSDMVNVSGISENCKCSICKSEFLEEIYSWCKDLGNYYLK